jgi:hypothetical protein
MIKTYEEHNLKVSDVEKKIRLQKIKHDKEIKELETFYEERLSRFNRNNSRNTNNSTTIKFIPSREKVLKVIDNKEKEKSKINSGMGTSEYKQNEKIRNLRLSVNKSRSRTHSQDLIDKSSNNLSRKDTNTKSIPKKTDMGNNSINNISNLYTNITKVDESSAKLLINKLKNEKEKIKNRDNDKKSETGSKRKYNKM